MKYYKRKRTTPKYFKSKRNTWGSIAQERAKKNLTKLIKEVVTNEAELKHNAASISTQSANASDLVFLPLTDVPSGTDNKGRIGVEITGDRFEITYNLYNKTNNDLFIRMALVEGAGRGATEDLSSTSGLYQDPDGNVVSFATAIGVAANASVMWKFDTPSSVKVLKEQVYRLPKFNSGNNGSSRLIKWKIPYKQKIRFVNPTQQGALMQSRRVHLLLTAWCPAGGTQSTYTYDMDANCIFYFKDT